jgi:membrane-associated protease RseP (regulator of RpoE activity)
MSTSPAVTVYIRAGDPQCQALLKYLQGREIVPTVRDVTSDPSATATLFGRLGKIVVPVTQIDDKLLVGFDPVQLARYLPRAGESGPSVAFGAAVRGVTTESAQKYGLPAPFGVEVGRVTPDSAADQAGVQTGDVITAIGPYTVQSAEQFRTAIAARQPGDTMAITVWRQGTSHELSVNFLKATVEA